MATPRSIKHKIELEGAEEVTRKLETIGRSGEDAFNKVGAASLTSAQNLNNFVQAFAGLERGFQSAVQGAILLAQRLGVVGIAMGGLAAAGSTVARVFTGEVGRAAGEAADKFGLAATRLGATIQQFERMRAAFNAAGQSSGDFNAAMQALNQQIGGAAKEQIKQAADAVKLLADQLLVLKSRGIVDVRGMQALRAAALGTGEAAEAARKGLERLGERTIFLTPLAESAKESASALTELGIKATDAAGNLRKPLDLVAEIADKFATIADPLKKAELAIKLFGDEAGPKLVPLLSQGSEAIGRLASEYERAGLTITAAQSEIGRRVSESFTRLAESGERLRTQIGLIFSEEAIRGADRFNSFILVIAGAIDDLRRRVNEPLNIALPEGKTGVELLFDRMVAAAKSAWDQIRAIWSQSPVDERTALPQGQSALSVLFGGDREAAQRIADAADATRELQAQRARLGQQVADAVTAERSLAQAFVQGGQAAVQAAQQASRAAQQMAQARIHLDPRSGGRFTGDGRLLFSDPDEPGFWLKKQQQGAAGGPFATFVDQAKQATAQVLQIFQLLGSQIPTALAAGGGAGQQAAAGSTFAILITGAQQTAQQILQIFTALGPQIGQAIAGVGQAAGAGAQEAGQAQPTGGPFAALIQAAQQAVPQIAAEFQNLGPAIEQVLQAIPQFVTNIMSQVGSAVQQMMQQIEQFAQQAIQQLQQVIEAARQAAAAAQAAATGRPFASGGYTGSGPSHKPAGVVHKGEYVQPAWVVRKPGVLGAMEWLRRTGDLPGLIERFTRGFDVGGLVGPVNLSPKLAYAGGGMVSGGSRNLGTLTLAAGGQNFRVFTDADTAASLVRYATLRNAVSGGRKPQRWGR